MVLLNGGNVGVGVGGVVGVAAGAGVAVGAGVGRTTGAGAVGAVDGSRVVVGNRAGSGIARVIGVAAGSGIATAAVGAGNSAASVIGDAVGSSTAPASSVTARVAIGDTVAAGTAAAVAAGKDSARSSASNGVMTDEAGAPHPTAIAASQGRQSLWGSPSVVQATVDESHDLSLRVHSLDIGHCRTRAARSEVPDETHDRATHADVQREVGSLVVVEVETAPA